MPTEWASNHVTHPSLRGKNPPNSTLIQVAQGQVKGFAAQTQPVHDRGGLIPKVTWPWVVPHLNAGEPGTDASLHSYTAEVYAQSPKALVLLLCSGAEALGTTIPEYEHTHRSTKQKQRARSCFNLKKKLKKKEKPQNNQGCDFKENFMQEPQHLHLMYSKLQKNYL